MTNASGDEGYDTSEVKREEFPVMMQRCGMELKKCSHIHDEKGPAQHSEHNGHLNPKFCMASDVSSR